MEIIVSKEEAYTQAQNIIDKYPYIGAFLSSAQGNNTAIFLMKEYAKWYAEKVIDRCAEAADCKQEHYIPRDWVVDKQSILKIKEEL